MPTPREPYRGSGARCVTVSLRRISARKAKGRSRMADLNLAALSPAGSVIIMLHACVRDRNKLAMAALKG